MHIVFIIQSLGIGGAELSLVNLINASDPAAFHFSIIVFDKILTVADRIVRKDVTIVHVPKRGKISRHLVGDLKKVLTSLEPDVVHTHLFTADIWGIIAARQLGIPTVCTEHDVNKDYGLVRHMLKRLFSGYPDCFAACSQSVADFMRKKYGVKKQINIIPNGVEINKLSALSLANFEEPWQIGLCGRLVTKKKGQRVAIAALALLKKYAWSLTVVGDGPDLASLKDLIKTKGLMDRIVFRSGTIKIENYLKECAIVLVPSLYEGLGVVAREAMFAGRLVVASRTGGLVESIEDGKTGVLVEPGSAVLLAEAIENIFNNPAHARALASAGQVYARAHFAMEPMVEAYAAVYRGL